MRNLNDSPKTGRQSDHLGQLQVQPAPTNGRENHNPVSIGVLIHDVARLRRYAFDEQARPMRLTRSQFWVLSHLDRQGDGAMNQSEIAAALEVGKVTLGGLVDRLEASGLVKRENCGEDRRVKRVRLTTKGKRALASTQRMRPLLDEFVLRDVAAHTRVELVDALATMRTNLLAMQRERRPRAKRN